MQEQEFNSKGALFPFLKRILKYAWRYKKWMQGFIFWVIIIGIVDASFPIALQLMIDDAVIPQLQNIKRIEGYEVEYDSIYKYMFIFLLISMLQIIGVYQIVKFTGRVSEHVMRDLRADLFKKLQHLSFSYYDKNASGWLLSRFTSDVDKVAEVTSWALMEATWGTTMIIFCSFALFYFNWQLALIVIISIPIMLLASIRIRMLVLKYSRESRKINSEITASYNEHVSGVSIIKSTAQEHQVADVFRKLSGRMRLSSYNAAFYTAGYLPIVILIGSLAAAGVVFWGGSLGIAASAGITVGILAAAFEYSMKIFFPIIDISMFYAKAQGSLSAGERIFRVLDEELEVKNSENATDISTIKGAIEFENVTFHYNADNPILKGFNLKIPAKQSIAFVGATGSGKSTVVKLISRFYEPVNGQIKIDGQDYKDFTLQSLRSQMGVVLQTPHLFAGTIRENIAFGKKNTTDEEIKETLRLVGAEQFIEKLDEQVGEDGSSFSLGQRQLLSFARALVANPRIFIMDEATSSIDTLTEAKIQQSIATILKGRTALIIAHRLSTIKNCDRILVIDKGNIIEDGSHQELIAVRGRYFNLYTKQLREEKWKTVLVDEL